MVYLKRHISLLLAAVLGISAFLPAVSCSSAKSSSDSTVQDTSAAVTTETTTETSTTTTTTTTTTTAPLMPPMTSPVEVFSDIDEPGEVISLVRGADNTILFHNYTDNGVKFQVFDPIHKKIVRTINTGNFSEELIGMFSDGTIAALNYSDNTVMKLYPKDSDTPKIVDLNEDVIFNMYIDMDHDYIYSAASDYNGILRFDSDGNKTELFKDRGLDSIASLNTDNMTFFGNMYSKSSADGTVPALFSLKSANCYTELSPECSGAYLTENYCIGEININSDAEVLHSLELYSLTDGKFQRTYDINDDTTPSGFTVTSSRYSDHLMLSSWKDDYSGTVHDIYFVDLKNGTITSIADYLGVDISQSNGCYCDDLGRWIIALNVYEGYSSKIRFAMVDPSLLKYDRKLEISKKEHVEYVPAKCGDSYRKVRKLADEIEKKYGITILVGDEVKNCEKGSDYTIHSTEESDYYTPEDIISNLEALDYQLSHYPDDFFAHFRTNGRFGLRIAFVQELTNDTYNSFTAGGIAYNIGPWYNIAIASNMLSFYSTSFHHEMWHSVEQLVDNNVAPILDSDWNALNPYGFSYTNDFDAYMETCGSQYTTLSAIEYDEYKDYNAPYFISEYSLVTPREDRATLIEYLTGWRFDENTEYQFGTTEMNKYPHLKAKLDFLADWTKQEFGYVYWEELLKNAEGTYDGSRY